MPKDNKEPNRWLIPDAFWHSQGSGCFPSHEAVCVLNTSKEDAEIRLTLFFENRDELGGFTVICPARRTRHIRMDKLVSESGQNVPIDVPYSILVESETDLAVQYSRMDTSQAEMALMTAIAPKL